MSLCILSVHFIEWALIDVVGHFKVNVKDLCLTPKRLKYGDAQSFRRMEDCKISE